MWSDVVKLHGVGLNDNIESCLFKMDHCSVSSATTLSVSFMAIPRTMRSSQPILAVLVSPWN